MILIRRNDIGVDNVNDIIAGAGGGRINHNLFAGVGLRAVARRKQYFPVHRILVNVHVVIAQHRERDFDKQLLARVILGVAIEMDSEHIAIDSVLTGSLRGDGRAAQSVAIPLQRRRTGRTQRAVARVCGEGSDATSEKQTDDK